MSTVTRALGIIILLFAAYSTDCIKITSLSVPEIFPLKPDSPDHVILDCEYELDKGETNLVVKWQKNGESIYQWIYGTPPTAFPSMRGKINETYEASSDDMQRYRALVLLNPSRETAGDYKCLVSVDQSVDAKTGHLEVLDFSNSSLNLKHKTVMDDIHVTCEAKNVYPKPMIKVTLNEQEELPITQQDIDVDSEGYYDVIVTGTLSSSDFKEDESKFGCLITFEGYNHTEKILVEFSGENEQFSFLEQAKNNATLSGASGLHTSALSIVIPLVVVVSLALVSLVI